MFNRILMCTVWITTAAAFSHAQGPQRPWNDMVISAAHSAGQSPNADTHRVMKTMPAAGVEMAALLIGERRSSSGAAARSAGPGLCAPLNEQFLLTGELPEADSHSAVAFTPDGALIILANRATQNLIMLDAETREFLGAIALSGSPQDVAISTDGATAVTANVIENTVSIIDLNAGMETDVINVGTAPGEVRLTPNGETAIVGNTSDSTLSIIDVNSATVAMVIPDMTFQLTLSIGIETFSIALDYTNFEMIDNTFGVFPDVFNDAIKIFNVETGDVTALPSVAMPLDAAVTPDGSTAVVSHGGGAQIVSVVDLTTPAITDTINVGVNLSGPIAVSPDGSKAVVHILNASRVVTLNTGGVSGDLDTASLSDLLTTSDGNFVLGVGFRGPLISFASESILVETNNAVSTSTGAVSPTGPRAAMVSTTFGEDLVVVNTDGAGAHLEFFDSAGPAPEGDECRTAAVTPDGTRALAVNNFSDNVTIFDTASREIEGYAPTGQRPAEIAVTSDGSQAVVANLDSTFATVIDLDTFDVTQIEISRRAAQVEISPDDQFAYLAVLADGDGVWRINLDTLAVQGPKLPTGNMSSIFFTFFQKSGMTLSHDGATLVTCNSFDDTITLIDATSWSVLTTFAVGGNPARAVFSQDDSLIYVSNRDSDTISVVENDGASSSVIDTINVGDQPFLMALREDIDRMFVMNWADNAIGVVNLNTLTQIDTISLPDRPSGMALHPDQCLVVSSGNASVSIGPGGLTQSQSGEVSVINTDTNSVTNSISTGKAGAMLALAANGSVAAVPSPTGDGLTLIDIGVPDCPEDIAGNDQQVNVQDLLLLLANWGTDGAGADIAEPNDTVDVADLLALLSAWGPC